ncbi:AGAP012644-PA-like protein [Anopheles sinensis]|uniref:ascorbate ferrireductase (transmembrane) n=1 Tax=Anopheles sinensis TaxID=74873 RepID=A0A084VSP2_ANOSI|nr:AGAP012644-PA-like protein [Anopheles sinensis]
MDELDTDDNVLRRPRTKTSFITCLVFNCLHPLCIFVPSILIIAVCWSRGLTHLFTWHVFLTGLGFHLLMAAGVALPNGGNSLARNSTHSTRRTIHWILQTVGGGCALIGTVLQYINRETKLKPHFVSTHSIVGLIAVVFVLLSLLNGVSALFGWKLRRFLRPSVSKLIHNATGVATFAMGMCAIALAYEYHIFKENFAHEVRILLVIVTVVTCVMSLFGVLKNIYNYLYETYLGCKSTEYILDDVE